MSKNVDERVVQMRFDNKQFESNIETSTKSLDRLKAGLNLSASAKSLHDLERAGKSFSLDGIGRGIDALTDRFSTMGIVGITAIQNVTNSAINAGKRLIKSLTVDPITTGLTEYETKMNAIQTMMTNGASRGTTLDQVNEGLAELNDYSDKTIYNFAQMTDNVGKFMAADVSLSDSITTVKGLSNVAAGFGVDAAKMANATYQMSQALSAGKVQLIDWKSMEMAGMGGPMLQRALQKTAKELGIVVDETANFRDTLKDGWLTSEVFIKTMDKMANDPALMAAAQNVTTFTKLLGVMRETVQSGWSMSWEHIFGDKDQSTKLFTAISNGFSAASSAAAGARNETLKFWNENDGRKDLLLGIANVLIGLADILEPIEEAFRDIFPAMTGKRLVEITKSFRELTEKFKIGEKTSENLKRTFKGLFSILDIGKKTIGFLANVIGKIIQAIAPGSDGLLSITANIGDFLSSINEGITTSNLFGKALEKVGVIIDFIAGLFKKASSGLGPIIDGVISKMSEWGAALKDTISGSTFFADAMTTIKDVFSDIGDKIASVFDSISGIVGKFTGSDVAYAATKTEEFGESVDKADNGLQRIKKTISDVSNKIKTTLAPVFTFLKEKLDGFSLGDLGAVLTGVGFLTFAKALKDGLGALDDIAKSFSKVLDQVANSLKAFQLKVKAEALLKIAIALAILAAALIALSLIPIEKLAASLGLLTVLFVELVIGMKVLNKMSGETTKIWEKSTLPSTLVALGASILLLAVAAKILASVDPMAMVQATIAIATMMAMIAIFIKYTNGGDLKKSAGGMIGFSIGITILAGALAILGNMDQTKLQSAMQSLAVMMGLLTLFVYFTNGGDLKKSAGGLIGFSIGIAILVGALSLLGNIDPIKLQQGMEALAALVGGIAVFVMVTNGGDLAKSAGSMIGFALGITILVGALSLLGKLDPATLEQGMQAIAMLVAGIAVFVMVTNGGDLAKSAGGMIGFAIGIAILSKSLEMLGNLDPVTLEQGTKAIAALLKVMAIFTIFTSGGDLSKSSKGIIGFAIGIIILSGALAILAAIPSNKIVQGTVAIGALMLTIAAFITLTKEGDLKKSASGLIGFAAGLAILAGTIAILSALDTNKLIAASVAMSLMMLSIATFIKLTDGKKLIGSALGLVVFSGAIYLLAQALLPLAQLDIGRILAASGAIAILMLGIAVFSKVTNGVQLIATAAGLAVFALAIGVLATSLTALGSIDVSTLLISAAVLAGTFVILGLAAVILAPLTPVIIGLSVAIMALGVGMLAAGAGVKMFAEGLIILASGGQPLIETISNIINLIPLLAKKIGEGIISFAQAIRTGIPIIVATLSELYAGLIKVMVDNIPPVVDATILMITTILQTLAQNIQPIVDAGMRILLGFLSGIADNIEAVVMVAIDLVVNFINGISSKIGDIIQAGITFIIAFINGLADGVRNNTDAVIDAGTNLATALLEAVGKALLGIADIGGNICQGLIDGIGAGLKKVAEAGMNLGSTLLNSAKKVLGINSPSYEFDEVGMYSDKGLANGVTDNADKPVKATEKMTEKVLDAADGIGLGKYLRGIGGGITESFAGGITESSPAAADASAGMVNGAGDAAADAAGKSGKKVKTAFEKAVDAIDLDKYYGKLSLDDELARWEALQTQYAVGTEERLRADKEVYRVNKEIRKKDYDDALANIEHLKKRHNLSINDEIKMIKTLRDTYEKNSEEWLALDDKLYDTRKEKRQEDFNDSLEAIDDEKYYKELSLSEELARIRKLQKKYEEGTEERKKLDKEEFRLTEEISDKKKAIDDDYYANSKSITDKLTDDIKSVQDAYNDALKSRTDELKSAYGLFDKVEEPEVQITGSELLSNLDGQVKSFETWQEELNKLTAKGVNQGLVDELSKMGPQSLTQIKALNTLTADQLDTYVVLWQTKYHDAKEQAAKELEPMREDTVVQIQALRAAASTELDGLKQTWIDKIGEITEGTKTKFAEPKWATVGGNVITGITSGVKEQAKSLATATAAVATSAMEAANKAIAKATPKIKGSTVGNNVSADVIAALTQAIVEISNAISGKIDINPTIRPVLDLTDVTNGLNSVFGKTQTLRVSVDKAATISGNMESSRSGSFSGVAPTSNKYENKVTVNNYNTVRNDQDIEKINIKLKNTINRYNNARGALV